VSPAAASAYRISAGSTSPTAGTGDALIITQVDQYQNVETGFTGAMNLTFAGLSAAINGNVPTVTDATSSPVNLGTSTTISFAAGVSVAGGTLFAYKAETSTLTATDGTLSTSGTGGTGVLLTVVPAAASGYRISATSTMPTAGQANQLTITQVDQYQNVEGSGPNALNGPVILTFSGLATAPDGTTVPTVADNAGTPTPLGAPTTVTFTNGVSTAGGLLTAYAAQTATLSASGASVSTAGTGGQALSLTVSPAAASAYRITAASTSPIAGQANQLTITQVDQYQNVESSGPNVLNGPVALTFSGLGTAGSGAVPTVTDKNGSAVALGSSTTITFVNGSSSVGGTLMAYLAGSPTLNVTDGTHSTLSTGGSGLALTVFPAVASALRITAANVTPIAGQTDQLTITQVDQYQNVDGSGPNALNGQVSLTFSGLATAPDGTTVPTVTNDTLSALSLGALTTVTFTNGVSTAGGLLTAYAAQTATLSASGAGVSTAGTGGQALSLTVSPAAASAYRITAATTTPTAGVNDQLTITLVDTYQNIEAGFTGTKSLIFSGLGTASSGTVPTVTDNTGSAINQGASTTISFTAGVSTLGGSLVAYKAETATLSASDGTLSTGSTGGTGTTLTVVPAAASAYRISADSPSVLAGSLDGLTISLVDPFQNVETAFTGTKNLTFSGLGTSVGNFVPTVTDNTSAPVNLGSTTSIDFTQGVSTQGGVLVPYKEETATLAVSDGVHTTGSAGGTGVSITVEPKTAHHLLFLPIAASTPAGDDITPAVQVQVVDVFGNLVPTDTSTVAVQIGANPGGSTLSGTPTVKASGGIATFSDLSFNQTGQSYTLLAADGTLGGATSNTFDITSAVADHLVFTTEPTSAVAGASISPSVVVKVLDKFGNVVKSDSSNVVLSIGTNPGGGTLSGMTTMAAVQGVATFTNVSIDKIGVGYTLKASDGTLTSTFSTPAFNITLGLADHLQFVSLPATTVAGKGIKPSLAVEIVDAFGNLETSFTSTLKNTFTIGVNVGSVPAGGSAFFRNNPGLKMLKAKFVQGVALFKNVWLRKAGTGYTLDATILDPHLNPTSLKGVSDPFAVTATSAIRISYTSGGTTLAPQSATVAQAFTNNLVATVRDRFGNVVSGALVTFKVLPSSGAGGTFQTTGTTIATAITDANGQASIALTANQRAGTYTVRASVAGSTTTALFSLKNVADVAVRFAIIAPADVNQGVAFSLTVLALDQFGNVDTNYLGTVHFASTDSKATLPPDLFFGNGRETFSAVLGTTGNPGAPNITVSSSDLNEIGNPVAAGGVTIGVLPPNA
jgi:hypothetical protein